MSGALFSLGWWIFFDALLLSSVRSKRPADADDPTRIPPWIEPAVKMSFADWLPGLLATLGMIVVNLIDKSILAEAGGLGAMGSFGGGGGDPIQWRARLFLFVGFALLAGGLAGSVTVLTIKYIIAQLPEGYEYYGFANVVSDEGCLMTMMRSNTDIESSFSLCRPKMPSSCFRLCLCGSRKVRRAIMNTISHCRV